MSGCNCLFSQASAIFRRFVWWKIKIKDVISGFFYLVTLRSTQDLVLSVQKSFPAGFRRQYSLPGIQLGHVYAWQAPTQCIIASASERSIFWINKMSRKINIYMAKSILKTVEKISGDWDQFICGHCDIAAVGIPVEIVVTVSWYLKSKGKLETMI